MERTITKTVGYSDYHKTNYTRTFTLVDSQEQIPTFDSGINWEKELISIEETSVENDNGEYTYVVATYQETLDKGTEDEDIDRVEEYYCFPTPVDDYNDVENN